MRIIEIALLIIPATIYALWNGRNGIKHPAYKQVITVSIIIFACPSLIRILEISIFNYPYVKSFKEYLLVYCPMFAVSITGYGLFFNPLMNYILLHKRLKSFGLKPWPINYGDIIYCLDHLSDTAIPDKWKWWRSLGWLGRLLVYVVLFGISLYWFW